MVEIAISVVAKLAEYLVDPTIHQLKYCLCADKIATNADTEKEELLLIQRSVQERVDEAVKRTERIDVMVNTWKNEVASLIAHEENLVQELRANNSCFPRWCPTWRKYRLCNELAKTTQQMIVRKTKSDKLEPFSHRVTVSDIEYHSSKDFKFYKATRKAYDELWSALQDGDSYVIGLWGMGGSGKTTLVKEVGKKAKESKLFDSVIITTISQTPNIQKIQDEIADSLGLKLEGEEKSEKGRAGRIAMRLQSPDIKEQVLIILDDVWATLNLEDIGNPFGDKGPRNCKVLLTTRRRGVCTLMCCQKTISMDLLKKDEAWDLFQTHAEVDDSARTVAQEVVMECKGLPIAIVATGKCLKGKGLDEMHVALNQLRHSKPIDVDEGERDAFTCLKLSYDYLRTTEAKFLFLMCAMFPEDHEIVIEDLFIYGVGLGLCVDADSFEIARSQVMTAINVLIESSLLMYSLDTENENCVRMHDLVRDVALWIAPKECGSIMVNCAKELNEFLEDKVVKNCYIVSSWNTKLKLPQFPSQLDAPRLELLLLNLHHLTELSCASFEGIKGLKILALFPCGSGRKQLHPPIQWLSNLRTLRMRDWELGDISYMVSLKNLEILDLKGSQFKKLPNGIEKLVNLKLLDLTSCRAEECFCKVVAKCSQLEEFHAINCIMHEECFAGVPALQKLTRYSLEIGNLSAIFSQKKPVSRELVLKESNISNLSTMIMDVTQRAVAIDFYKLQGGHKSFSPDVVQTIGGLNELTELHLERCSEIECFADQTVPYRQDKVFLRLVKLNLDFIHNLTQLYRSPPNLSLILNLESLRIHNCPQLINMFPPGCNLGKLKSLDINACGKLASVFPVSVAHTLSSLEELTIKDCWLMHVIERDDSVDTLICDGKKTNIVLPVLEYLELEDVYGLLRICPESYHLLLPSIRNVSWWGCPSFNASCDCLIIDSEIGQPCPNMETHAFIDHQERNKESRPLAAISNVERIRLWDCGVISTFIPQTPIFRRLKGLFVLECAKLKFVFTACICQSLPELTSIYIEDCEEMEQVFLGNEETWKNLSTSQFCLPNLKRLRIKRCSKLKSIFSFSTHQTREISTCSRIRDHDIINSEREIMFPKLSSIELEELPRLSDFCQGFKFKLPDFCSVLVIKCPKLVPKKSAISWQIQKGMVVHRKYVLECSHFDNKEDLSPPLLPLIPNWEAVDNPSVRVLDGCRIIDDNNDSSDMFILQGLAPTQILNFQFLVSLEVVGCQKLRYLFSASTIVQNSLPILEFLTISGCDEMEEIVAASLEEPQNISNAQVCFPNLRELEIEKCNKLKRLFSTTVTTIVPQLCFLLISEANQLEVIFDHFPNPSSNFSLSLPELAELKVSGCSKLKCLFSLPCNADLPKLASLKIRECSQLEQVFSCDELEILEQESYKNLLPSLDCLQLQNLPKLTHICSSDNDLFLSRFMSLRNFRHSKCPMLQNNVVQESEDFDDQYFFFNYGLVNFETTEEFLGFVSHPLDWERRKTLPGERNK